MARETTHPLTPEEAKARLREVVADVGLLTWTRDHPLQGVSFAFLLGVLTGGSPDTRRAIQNAMLLFALDP